MRELCALHFLPATGWRGPFAVNKGELAVQLFLPHQVVWRIVDHSPLGFSDGLAKSLANHLRQEEPVTERKIGRVPHRGKELTKLRGKFFVARQQVDVVRRP